MKKYVLMMILNLIIISACKDNPTNLGNTGKISGKVLNGKTLEVISGVQITTSPSTNSILNKDDGTFVLNNIESGDYVIYAKKYGFNSNYVNVKVINDKTTEAVILLYDLQTTNNTPEIPSLITPIDNAVVPPEKITFSWTCSDKDNDQLKYTVLLSKENPPTSVVANEISSTDFIINNLDTASTYYWKVIAKDNYTFSESEVRKFVVKKGAIDNSPELILHYSFDNNNANDESGNGNNGILMNNPSFVSGKKNIALQIDGTLGQHVVLPNLEFNLLKEFTIALWIKQVDQLNDAGEAYIIWGLHSDGWVGIGNFKNIENGEMSINFSCGAIAPGWGKIPLYLKYQVANNNIWTHYALVFKDGLVKGYINGNYVGQKEQVLSVLQKYAYIGKHTWFYDYLQSSTAMIFSVDDVRVYKNDLSEEQVKALAK